MSGLVFADRCPVKDTGAHLQKQHRGFFGMQAWHHTDEATGFTPGLTGSRLTAWLLSEDAARYADELHGYLHATKEWEHTHEV